MAGITDEEWQDQPDWADRPDTATALMGHLGAAIREPGECYWKLITDN